MSESLAVLIGAFLTLTILGLPVARALMAGVLARIAWGANGPSCRSWPRRSGAAWTASC